MEPLLAYPPRGSSEASPSSTRQYRAYFIRWPALFAFSLFGFTQGLVWNTWGPVEKAAWEIYGFSGDTVLLLANCGPYAFIPTVLPWIWALDAKGLRFCTLLACSMVVIGTGLRLVTMGDGDNARWLIIIGHILNGIAGPVVMAVPPRLSAVFFKPGERAKATAINTAWNYTGVALSFVFGPLICTADDDRSGMRTLLFKDFVLAAISLVAVFFCLPERPPSPPSASSQSERTAILAGVRELFTCSKHANFWLLAGIYGFSTGIYAGWGAALDIIMSDIGFSAEFAGWLGFASVIGGCLSSIAFSAAGDAMKSMKGMLLFMFAASTLSQLWVALAYRKIVSHSSASLLVSGTLGGIFINGAIPLFYEMTVEATHPIPENVCCGVMASLNNIGAFVFLQIPVDQWGVEWLNWVVVAVCGVSGLCLLQFKEDKKRLAEDTRAIVNTTPNTRAFLGRKVPVVSVNC